MNHEHDSAQGSPFSEEIRLIPGWSIVLAVVAFTCAQYFVHGLMPHHRNSGAPLGMRIFWGISWGAVLAVYMLLIGYISRDARRRNMNAGLWMLIAVLMPGAIGTVVYFLLRQPLVAPCPGCGSSIESGSNFCRQCRFQVGRVCQVCHRSARATDVYCLHCGHELALDPAPQRLRAYQE